MRDRVRTTLIQPVPRLHALLGAVGTILFLPGWLLAQETIQMPMYGEEFPLIGSRVAIWVAAERHRIFLRRHWRRPNRRPQSMIS